MSEQQKIAIEMFMDLPQQLAEIQTDSQPVWSVIGSKDLSIDSELPDTTEHVKVNAILLEVIPDAAALLARVARVRGREYAKNREGQDTPFYDRAHKPADIGFRVRFLVGRDLEETEIGIDAERAQDLIAARTFCRNVLIGLDFNGAITIKGVGPYYIPVSAMLDAEMLEQMANWEPEENSRSSPSMP